MRLSAIIVAVGLAAAACGGAAGEPAAAPLASTSGEATTTTDGPQASTSSAAPAEPVPEGGVASSSLEVDMVTYVAALEDALADTAYAGQALDAPEVFLATGALFCDQLDGGMTPDQILVTYVEALTGGPLDEAGDDELDVAGSILGVGVVTLCPAHLDTVAASG